MTRTRSSNAAATFIVAVALLLLLVYPRPAAADIIAIIVPTLTFTQTSPTQLTSSLSVNGAAAQPFGSIANIGSSWEFTQTAGASYSATFTQDTYNFIDPGTTEFNAIQPDESNLNDLIITPESQVVYVQAPLGVTNKGIQDETAWISPNYASLSGIPGFTGGVPLAIEYDDDATTRSPVPEPPTAALILVGLGLICLAGLCRKGTRQIRIA